MSQNDDEYYASTSSEEEIDNSTLTGLPRKKFYIEDERTDRDALGMNDNFTYLQYTSFPYVECVPEFYDNVALAHISREFMSSARLLPSVSKSIFKEPSEIQRYQYIGKLDDYPIWYFNAKYFHGRNVYRFINEETDISGIDVAIGGIEKNEKMAKRMYIFHYFKHDNLLRAYFTLSEPWIYRMNTALPNNISLLALSRRLRVRENNQCPSIKYVAVCILRALEYLHESNIVHKNVSILNCICDFNGNVLLGEFENTDVCLQQFEKSYDIWNVGTTLLDYCFANNEYGELYPNPTCINGYENLFDKMLRRQRPVNENERQMDGNNNDPETLIFSRAIHEIIHNFATEEMYGFLLRIFQGHFRPSAATLLASDEFLRIEDFEQIKLQMADVCQDLGIKPFCADVPIPPSISKPVDVLKKKPYNKFVCRTIPRSKYRGISRNPLYHFENQSEIHVDFTIISQIYDGSYTFNEMFYVGDERSIFKALFNLIKDVDGNSPKTIPKILRQNGAYKWWYPLRYRRRFFFAWDIFRLRAALDAMLSDAANCENANILYSSKRRFPLCHHKQGISRHVDIEIRYSPADIKIKQQ